jgi:hypothetical protein
MRLFRWASCLAVTVGAAVVIGCVSEAPDGFAGRKSDGDALRPLTDPSSAGADANGPRGNGNGNANDNGSSGPCDPNCPDFDGDGVIGMQDLAYLLSSFSQPPSPACTDIDGSGLVDLQDLAYLLGTFGTSCTVNGNGNTNDNGAGNTNDNGTGNTNDNGTGNTNDNGAGNTNDNGAGNTNDNGAGNTNDNGAGNTNDNGAGNGNANDNGSGDCPDGSTQLATGLSDGGDAEYRQFPQGCARFRVRTSGAAPSTTLQVTINGVIVGTLTTDDRGRGELRYDTSDGNFPPNFPAVHAGDVVGVGGTISGVFGNDCSSNSNCNG